MSEEMNSQVRGILAHNPRRMDQVVEQLLIAAEKQDFALLVTAPVLTVAEHHLHPFLQARRPRQVLGQKGPERGARGRPAASIQQLRL